MLISSFSGPVGFQYNNMAMAKGMFTSIGMVRESLHPTTQSQSRVIWGVQSYAPIFREHTEQWALPLLFPPKSRPKQLSHPYSKSLCPYPRFCCLVLDHLMSHLLSLNSFYGWSCLKFSYFYPFSTGISRMCQHSWIFITLLLSLGNGLQMYTQTMELSIKYGGTRTMAYRD